MFSLTYSDKNTKVSIQYDTIDDLKKFYHNFGKMFGCIPEPEQEPVQEPVQEPEQEPVQEPVQEPNEEVDDDITLSDTTSTISSIPSEVEDSKDNVRLTSQIPELEVELEQKSEINPIEFPMITTKDEFIQMLKVVGITSGSYKNYMKYWQYPIFTEIHKRNIDSVVNLLSGLSKDIGDNASNINRVYNLFCLIFKINNHYKVFSDLNAVNKLFDPVKSLKTKVSQKKTPSKQQK